MSWEQMKPTLAEVSCSDKPPMPGWVYTITRNSPGQPGHGEQSRMAILGPATLEDYVNCFHKEPEMPKPWHFSWVHFD